MTRDLIERLARTLDGLVPLVEKAAATEEKREKGKVLRCISNKKRLADVNAILADANEYLSKDSPF